MKAPIVDRPRLSLGRTQIGLLAAYAVATLFPRLLDLPLLGGKLQLTEIFFVSALPFFFVGWRKPFQRHPGYVVAVALYVGANLISGFASGSTASLMEAFARAYLAVLSLFVLSVKDPRRLMATVQRWWVWGTFTVAAGCALVWLFVVAGGHNPYIMVAHLPNYPYLGWVYRMRGTANVYGMFAMLLLPGGLLAYVGWRDKQLPAYVFAIIFLAAGMTLAKEALLYLIGCVLLQQSRAARSQVPPPARSTVGRSPMGLARLASATALTCLLWVGTHYVAHRPNSALEQTEYVTGRQVAYVGPWVISETNYVSNKRAAARVGLAYPLVGVGPGQYQAHTDELIERGVYPEILRGFNPHSAWTGAFAETGVLGLLALSLLVITLIVAGRRPLSDPLAVLLLLFLIASVFKDTMNFRGLWLLIGLYLLPPEKS